jgi:fructosamine-3-kinase
MGRATCVNTAHTLAAAEHVLTAAVGTVVQLHLAEVVYDYPGAPSTILRYLVHSDGAHGPARVIVKRTNTPALTLCHEAAGLVFVNKQTSLQGLVPQCYGIDSTATVLVMEALAAEPDQLLGTILFGSDAAHTEQALVAYNSALGTMHGATMGQATAYYQIRACYGASHPSRHRIHRILDDLRNLGPLLESTGIALPVTVQHEVRDVLAALHEPGPFFTFTHGDATPANVFVTPTGVRLFDFDTSAFRHALLDGAFARLRYLYSIWARQIPVTVQRRVAATYRDALATRCAAATDDAVFNRALITGCTAWLARLCALLPTVHDQDQRWGRSTNRQRIVAGLEHFACVANEVCLCPGLAERAHVVGQRLHTMWGEGASTMRLYPAFEPASNNEHI